MNEDLFNQLFLCCSFFYFTSLLRILRPRGRGRGRTADRTVSGWGGGEVASGGRAQRHLDAPTQGTGTWGWGMGHRIRLSILAYGIKVSLPNTN
jgi:hypothetical protein